MQVAMLDGCALPSDIPSPPEAALQDLFEARTARLRLDALPRRSVTPGLNVLLWALRLYVLGMTGALVVHAVLTL